MPLHQVPDYLLRTAFVFDDLRLVYAPVPKAGSTAVLGALAKVVGLGSEDFARSRKLEVTRSLAVHDGSIWGPTYRLEGRSTRELEAILASDEWYRVTVVREPARRLWSAWVSKVLVRDPRFVAAFGQDWFPAVPSTAQDVLDSFRRFVGSLQQAERHDAHWLPQAGLVGAHTIAYDHVGRVEELDRTEAVLGEYLSSKGETLPAVRRENPSILPFASGLFDRQALDVSNLWTEPDRVAFGYGPLTTGPEEPDGEWFTAVNANIPSIRAVIERNERIGDLRALLEDSDAALPARPVRSLLRGWTARRS